MGDIERLDYSKPPPGFDLTVLPRSLTRTVETAGVWGPTALAAAWTHYKECHDAPGLEVRWLGGQRSKALYGVFGLGQYDRVLGQAPTPESARAAAWAWYDRRLALAARVVREVVTARERLYEPLDAWPRCPTWSDTQVAEVERWLSDSTAAVPEVLRA